MKSEIQDEIVATLKIKTEKLANKIYSLRDYKYDGDKERAFDKRVLVFQFLLCVMLVLGDIYLIFAPYFNQAALRLPSFIDEVAAFMLVILLIWLYQSYIALKLFWVRQRQLKDLLREGEEAVKNARFLLHDNGFAEETQ